MSGIQQGKQVRIPYVLFILNDEHFCCIVKRAKTELLCGLNRIFNRSPETFYNDSIFEQVFHSQDIIFCGRSEYTHVYREKRLERHIRNFIKSVFYQISFLS